MEILTFHEYETKTKIVGEFKNFVDALVAQEMFSKLAEAKGWTRHSSCTSIIRHANIVSDLYNEGGIMLNIPEK